MRDLRREAQILLQGGLDLETPALTVEPGRMLACKNFEVNTLGGYTRIEGYERYDGQPEPSATRDTNEREVRRSAIGKPPGQGGIRGVFVFKGDVYCFRDQADGALAFSRQRPAAGVRSPRRPGTMAGAFSSCRTTSRQAPPPRC
jgi:hypothetical protein